MRIEEQTVNGVTWRIGDKVTKGKWQAEIEAFCEPITYGLGAVRLNKGLDDGIRYWNVEVLKKVEEA